MTRNRLTALALALGLLAATPLLQAQSRGVGVTGIPYVSGGVGASEQGLLYEERLRYTVWLTTAAKGSGAYLAGTQVKITDLNSRQMVLEAELEGPWLMAGLPAGRYALEARYRPTSAGDTQIRQAAITVGDRGLRHLVLYFDADDQVGSTREPPFESRPGAPSGTPRQAQERSRRSSASPTSSSTTPMVSVTSPMRADADNSMTIPPASISPTASTLRVTR